MEEEIDLRPYIEAIIKHWYWIVGAAIVAGLVAFGVSSLLPPKYEATALVAVTLPKQLTFTSLTQDGLVPSFASQTEAIPYLRAFPELATGDQLVQELMQSMDPPLDDIESVEEMQELLEAVPGSDPTLIRLTATHRNPETAARIANNWAALYVPWANMVFGQTSDDRVLFLQDQLADTRSNLETAEDALIAFEANNRIPILRNQLTFLTQKQGDLLAQQGDLQLLAQDAAGLQAQIEALSGGSPVSLAHQMTALNLQLRAFAAENSAPLQLQLDETADLTGADRAAQLVFLSGLAEALTARLEQVEADLADVEPQILSAQQQLQAAETQHNRLTSAYSEAEETYTALTRRLESERLSAEDTTTGARLASNSAVPEEPEGSGRISNALIAFVLGLLICTMILVANVWWRSFRQS